MKRRSFCIFIDTFFQGAVPCVLDEKNKPFLFETKVDAQREIADHMQTRLQQFIDGDRDFEDAVTNEEYVVEVEVLDDGSVMDLYGKRFGPECI
jgi:hypothetical protein